MRWEALLLAALAAGLAGCTQVGPFDDPLPGPVPECDFETHRVRVEVQGVDAPLTRAEVHDPRGDVQAMSSTVCAAPPRWARLEVQGPSAAEGQLPAFHDVDQLWLGFEAGLLRVGTNVSVHGNGTLRVQARGPPVRDANLSWNGQPAEVRWTEWHDDPGALDPSRVRVGPLPLENTTGTLTLPVNSSRNDGIDVGFDVDVNESRHENWSAYGGPREGVRVEVHVLAPDGSQAASGNWTPANGTDPRRLDVPAPRVGNWTLRYQVRGGQADPGDLLYRIEAGLGYGARPG